MISTPSVPLGYTCPSALVNRNEIQACGISPLASTCISAPEIGSPLNVQVAINSVPAGTFSASNNAMMAGDSIVNVSTSTWGPPVSSSVDSVHTIGPSVISGAGGGVAGNGVAVSAGPGELSSPPHATISAERSTSTQTRKTKRIPFPSRFDEIVLWCVRVWGQTPHIFRKDPAWRREIAPKAAELLM